MANMAVARHGAVDWSVRRAADILRRRPLLTPLLLLVTRLRLRPNGQAGLVSDLPPAKKNVIDREIFCLLEEGLAPNLMSFVSELLGPDWLRRRPMSLSAGATTSASQVGGVFAAL